MVETDDEAELLGEAVNYPPERTRGIASGRAAEYGKEFIDYVSEANGSIVTIAQIESRTGLKDVKFDFLIVDKDTSYLANASRSAKKRYEDSVARRTDTGLITAR